MMYIVFDMMAFKSLVNMTFLTFQNTESDLI